MARHKPYNLKQDKFIALSYADQMVAGSFEYALNEIVEEHLDLSVFERRYRNDETGRLAYDPKVLLKIVLYGYSKGMVSSRKLEEACRRNVVFMALSADTRPHFTTIRMPSRNVVPSVQVGGQAIEWALSVSNQSVLRGVTAGERVLAAVDWGASAFPALGAPPPFTSAASGQLQDDGAFDLEGAAGRPTPASSASFGTGNPPGSRATH